MKETSVVLRTNLLLGGDPNKRKVQIGKCPECFELVLGGLSSRMCAWPVLVDAIPLTWAGELAAAFEDRATYEFWNQRLEIRTNYSRRRQSDITVVADHRCSQPIPDSWKAPTVKRWEMPDEPPF